jgi:hypothetical protein
MSPFRVRAASLPLLGLLALSACGPFHGGSRGPDLQNEWATTLAYADREVLATRFGVADKLLADFAERHAKTSEGYEATFWRALYKLDPTNGTATPHDAAVLLDAYLASSLTVPHRGAATTLRRVAGVLDKPPAVAAAGVPTAPASTASDKARDEELVKVKEELAKANAELERIKRRVATPKP